MHWYACSNPMLSDCPAVAGLENSDNLETYEPIQPRAIADTTHGVAYADVGDVVGHTNDAGYAQPDSSYSQA